MTIEEILEQYGVSFVTYGQHHHVTRGWINVDCPYCSPHANKFRLGFNIAGKWWTCWSCGPHRLYDVLMELTGISFAECKELLGTFETQRNHNKSQPRIRRGSVEYPKNVGPFLQPHRDYLMRRGLNPTTLENQWGIRGIGLAPKLQWRLFIPIVFDHEVISWTTRSISDATERRYIHADAEQEKIPSKHVLYGEDLCKQAVIIAEGPIDAWKIGPGGVATMGASYSQAQLLRMTRYPKRIVCFDADPPGQLRAQQLLKALSVFPGETINVVLDSSKDPGGASLKEIRQLRKLLK